MPSFLSPLLREPSHQYRLLNERTGHVIADRLLSSFDSKTRRTGLLAHDTFPRGSAMIIAPTNAIHTFFMKFAIDVLFVARDGRIVKIREAIHPWRMSAAWGGYGVIELSAGSLEQSDIRPGDRLRISRIDASAV